MWHGILAADMVVGMVRNAKLSSNLAELGVSKCQKCETVATFGPSQDPKSVKL